MKDIHKRDRERRRGEERRKKKEKKERKKEDGIVGYQRESIQMIYQAMKNTSLMPQKNGVWVAALTAVKVKYMIFERKLKANKKRRKCVRMEETDQEREKGGGGGKKTGRKIAEERGGG